ncbi:hypothetical protein SDJN03_02136, partial [Cucurbita argyrosperma subsp. sororia]
MDTWAISFLWATAQLNIGDTQKQEAASFSRVLVYINHASPIARARVLPFSVADKAYENEASHRGRDLIFGGVHVGAYLFNLWDVGSRALQQSPVVSYSNLYL